MRTKMWDALFHTVNSTLLIVFTIACIYPFYYIFIYSISDPIMAAKGITLWPAGFTLSNYEQTLQLKNIYNAFFISSARAVIGTIVTVLCCSFFAYILTKEQMYLRKLIYRAVVITLYLNAGLIPWYITMKELGLKNNFLLYILPAAIIGFYIILVKTFVEQLPPALEESAAIDGAGYLKIFNKIIFPLSMPIIATIAVFSAVNQWNSWTDNFFLVSSANLQTLQLTLLNFLRESESLAQMAKMGNINQSATAIRITPTAVKMTITMIVTLPILFVYPFLQKYFVKGIMLGAVKG